MRKIIKLFQSGNVCVCGLRGRGKDMLMSNVAVRRGLPYVCNSDYGGNHLPFKPLDYDCGGNTYQCFLTDKLHKYIYPHPDGTDIYISDAGIYFPSQYCGELNKFYGYFSSFMALSRHLGECNVHFNAQNLNRVWDKIREQSDIYIMCNWCKVFFGKLVIQRVTLYENYDLAANVSVSKGGIILGKTPERIRSRVFVGLWYPEDPTHVNAMKLLNDMKFQYVAILHDKDVYDKDDAKDEDGKRAGDLKKEHWHLVIKFQNARSIFSLADELGIKSNYLQCCSNTTEAYRYLLHFGWEYKHQYNAEECFGPLAPAVHKVCIETDENVRFGQIMSLLDECGLVSAQKFYSLASEVGLLADCRRFGGVMLRFIDDHNDRILRSMSSERSSGAYANACDNAHFRGFIEGHHRRTDGTF